MIAEIALPQTDKEIQAGRRPKATEKFFVIAEIALPQADNIVKAKQTGGDTNMGFVLNPTPAQLAGR